MASESTPRSETGKRGPYRRDHFRLKVSKRQGREYYSVQVPVPKSLRSALNRRHYVRYLGAVTEQEAKRRAPSLVAEVEEKMRADARAAGIDQTIEGVRLFGPMPELTAVQEAGRAMESLGVPRDRNTLERVTINRLERERRSVEEGEAAAADGSVRAVLEDWLEYKAGTGRQTANKARGERYRAKVAREFWEFVGEDKPFADVDHVDGQRFQKHLLDRGHRIKTVDNKLTMIRGCFTDRRPGTHNPFAGLTHGKEAYAEQERARIDFDDAQVLAILEAAKGEDPAFRWYVWTAAYTGARLGELLTLERDDFDFREGAIYFNRRTPGKTVAARRTVPIHPELAGLGEYVRKCRGRPFDFSTSTVGRKFPKLQSRAGVPAETVIDGDTYALSFHSFRHGVKTRLLNAGVSTDLADRLLGHVRQGLNPRYGKRSPELDKMREALERLEYKA